MGAFVDVTLSRVPAGIEMPEPIRMLFEWVEAKGFVQVGFDGELVGTLAREFPGPGTNVELRGFRPDEVASLAGWLGPIRGGFPTLWPFCRTGGDGSMAAL